MSDEQAAKDELLRVLESAKREAAQAEAMGQQIARAARQTLDIASATQAVVTEIPSDSLQSAHVERGLASWRDLSEAVRELAPLKKRADSITVMLSGTTNTTLVMVTALQYPAALPKPAVAATEKLFQVIDRGRILDNVRSAMAHLRLDSRVGTARAAPELFDEALGALERPVVADGGPTSVLIPLRESIDAAITELVRRRPVQESAKNSAGKVRSVGKHCGHSHVPSAYFERLALEAEELMSRLSGFKQQGGTREQVNEFFFKGITFLDALLSGVDKGKLRP